MLFTFSLLGINKQIPWLNLAVEKGSGKNAGSYLQEEKYVLLCCLRPAEEYKQFLHPLNGPDQAPDHPTGDPDYGLMDSSLDLPTHLP